MDQSAFSGKIRDFFNFCVKLSKASRKRVIETYIFLIKMISVHSQKQLSGELSSHLAWKQQISCEKQHAAVSLKKALNIGLVDQIMLPSNSNKSNFFLKFV